MALPTEKTTATTFVREGSPPGGTVASPGPQYWSPDNTQWELVQGENGAIFAISAGLDGATYRQMQVDSAGRLSVRVSDGTDNMAVNTDGSLNVVIGDGTDSVEVNSDGSLNVRGDETIVEDSQTSSASVAIGGGADTFTLTPTAGTMAELVSWHLQVAPNGAWSSGHHDVSIRHSASTWSLLINWQYTDSIFVYNGIPDTNGYTDPLAAATSGPRDAAAYVAASKGLFFSSVKPLVIEYLNFASDATTETRIFHAVYIERKVT